MITFLKGLLVEKDPARVVLDVGGVGYELTISLTTYDRLPDEGAPCQLQTYDHIREDAHDLFGFATDDERQLFKMLLSVSGIGPKTAMAVLSGLSVRELKAAIVERDVKRLSSISGVGKKTAERLVLELKDRVKDLAVPVAPSAAPAGALRDDVASALANLGYARADADRALDRSLKAHPEARFEELLRETLRLLSGAR